MRSLMFPAFDRFGSFRLQSSYQVAIGLAFLLWIVIFPFQSIRSTFAAPIQEMEMQKDQNTETDRIKKLNKQIGLAQDHYKKKEYDKSTTQINLAIESMKTIAKGAEDSEAAVLKRQLPRIRKAIRLLKSKGQKPNTLPLITIRKKSKNPTTKSTPTTPKTTPPKKKVNSGISFSSQVAPILSNRCGRCHVARASGGVRFQRFTQLENLIELGDADSSQLYDVISSGQMPPGNNKVPDAEQEILKKWIDQGAKFDGADVQADIRETAEKGTISNLDSAGLTNKRLEEAKKAWDLALPGQKYSLQQTDQFQAFVARSIPAKKWKPFMKEAEKSFKLAKKKLGNVSKNPFSEAKPILFVTGNFYDFSEFHRILIKRPVSPKQKFRFGSTTAGTYLVLRSIPNEEFIEAELPKIMASLAVSTLQQGTPTWFSRSVGASLLKPKKSKKNTESPVTISPADLQPKALSAWEKGNLEGLKKEKILRAVSLGWGSYGKQKRSVLKKISDGKSFQNALETAFKADTANIIKTLAFKGLQKQK